MTYISPASIDFGSIVRNGGSGWSNFTLVNPEEFDKELYAINYITGGGPSPYSTDLSVPQTIYAYNNISGNIYFSDQTVGTFNQSIDFLINGETTLSLQVSGIVEPIPSQANLTKNGEAITAYDFETVYLNDTAQVTFEFSVSWGGDESVTITNISVSDSFTIISYPTGAIAPGNSANIVVELNTSTIGTYVGELQIYTDARGGGDYFNVTLTGIVSVPYMLTDDQSVPIEGTFNIGTTTHYSGDAVNTLFLFNLGISNLDLLVINGDGVFSAVSNKDTILHNEYATITATMSDNVVGNFEGELTFTTSKGTFSQMVSGIVNPIPDGIPVLTTLDDAPTNTYSFGNKKETLVSAGEVVGKLRLWNLGESSLIVSNIEFHPDFNVITNTTTIAPANYASISVALINYDIGSHSGNATFVTSGGNVSLRLNGLVTQSVTESPEGFLCAIDGTNVYRKVTWRLISPCSTTLSCFNSINEAYVASISVCSSRLYPRLS